VPGFGRLMVHYAKERVVVIQGILERFVPCPPPVEIRQFVPRDSLHPGRQRLRSVVSMALIVNSE